RLINLQLEYRFPHHIVARHLFGNNPDHRYLIENFHSHTWDSIPQNMHQSFIVRPLRASLTT
ncbi:MAG TPA: hypothetical protein VK462_01505, partial [Nitrososphaeraceae archaeon]|nr:hypothetical protein [Nitrososphaeraceae archaeon]